MQDDSLRRRLNDASGAIVDAAARYVTAGYSGRLHAEASAEYGLPDVTVDEMKWVYRTRFARKGTPGKAIYEAVMAGAKNGHCPYCADAIAANLDHFLPQAHCPALAVNPANLVPACRDCNTEKRDSVPSGADEILFHPYFDDIDGVGDWLSCHIVVRSPPAVRFFVDDEVIRDSEVGRRAGTTFQKLGLASRYALKASSMLRVLSGTLQNPHSVNGARGVSSHLAAEAEEWRSAGRNSWQAALHRSLALDEDYCAGGFATGF